ncbi:MAG TPA: glycosyltransferase family 4 protein [Micropepsaceae bacterium]|nr:glycosyltransferase family 4 protein [Micropepsaceae bacterium]
MQPILLNWAANNFYGWGIVGLNLLLHWANDSDIRPLMGFPIAESDFLGVDPLKIGACSEAIQKSNQFQNELRRFQGGGQPLPMTVVEGLGNGLFRPGGLRGTRTMGRCIFEDTNLERLDEKLTRFDVLVCASHWNAQLLRAHCTKRIEIIFEGIDPSQFHPAAKSGVLDRSRFYIFSGGKVEFRKGHDLVLLAFKEFSRRHDDAVLVTVWHSPWPELSAGFQGKLHAPLGLTPHGTIDVRTWVARNGIDPAKIIEIGQVPNALMPSLLREMDCALAPSRAEACTNLLAKEAMACGVPVILAANTGVKDLIAEGNSLALTRQRTLRDYPLAGTEGWGESDVEEILEALERLYSDTALRKGIGEAGAAWIVEKGRTWSNHARQLKSLLLSL